MIALARDLYLPLILSNVLHMIVVKKNLLSFLSIPIAPKLFGANKTLRGFIFVPLVTGIFYLLLTNRVTPYHPFIIGMILGFAYMFFELPNSYVKRKLGVKAGEKPQHNKLLFTLMDKTDSAFGIALIYSFLFKLKIEVFFALFLFASVVHFIFSYLLVIFRVKESL